MQMSRSQWLLLGLLSVLWGSSFYFQRLILDELPPATVVLARVGGGLALLVAWLGPGRIAWPRQWSQWAAFAVMAIFNNVAPFLLITRGQQEVASGLTSVVNATTPLWSVVLAHFFTPGERITLPRLAGVLVGIGGVALLMGPEALLGRSSSVLGMALVLGAAISYGCASVWGRRFRETPAAVASCCQLACSTTMLLPVVCIVDRPWTLPAPSLTAIAAMIGLAAFSTAWAYVVFYRIMAVSGGTNVMLAALLMPVVAIVLGVAGLGESFLPRHGLGAAVIGAALLIIDGRVARYVAERSGLRPHETSWRSFWRAARNDSR